MYDRNRDTPMNDVSNWITLRHLSLVPVLKELNPSQ